MRRRPRWLLKTVLRPCGGSAIRLAGVMTNMRKRSVLLHGRKTSLSLEAQFWDCLKQIADREGLTLSGLVARIDDQREWANLSSAVRLFVLHDLQARIDPAVRFGPQPEGRAGTGSS